MRLRVVAALALAVTTVAGCSSDAGSPDESSTVPSRASSTTTPAPPTSMPAPTSSAGSTSKRRTSTTRPSTPAKKSSPARTASPRTSRPADSSAQKLPLALPTADAGQVVTVTASGHSSTTATLQRWKKVDGGWARVGSEIDAFVGAAGIGHAHEGSSKTPAGSFTLTEAFGRDGDPGTRLQYFRTTPADYWMSSAGPKYNTHQRCGSCGYDNGVNERLHEITPEYDQAVVIDYNRAPVRPGAGSAFFLHVSGGEPTAGCVSIPMSALVSVMRWLNPAKHPRILIGTV